VYSRDSVEKAVEQCLSEAKGKRKFIQSIDLAVNLRGMDFTKPENRLSLEVVLPYQPKARKVAVFAEGAQATEAKAKADLVINSTEIPVIGADKKRAKELLDYSLLATPAMMAPIGKALGTLLAPRGKMPRLVSPNARITEIVDSARRTVTIRMRGKYLPSVGCIVGNENMPKEQIAENISAVMEAISKRVGDANVANAYVKATMAPAVPMSSK
jgi:large subunit ribosomal protein L1